MSQRDVFVLGGSQTDFSRNWSKEDLGLEEMMREVLTDALTATGLEAQQIEKAHLGNFTAELFCAQGQLGGIFASLLPGLSGIPSTRHEAACASGSMAILGAMADIEAGRYDLVCVLGIEYMRNVSGQRAAEYLGCAAYAGKEWEDATYLWPRAFSDLTEAYGEKHKPVDYRHLGEIARINYENARRNPNAQTRDWTFSNSSFTENDDTNPVIENRVRRNDCGQVTDGAAVIFLASEEFMKTHAKRHGKQPGGFARIEGWGHRTATMLFADKLAEAKDSPYVLPQINLTIQECFDRAGINDVFHLDLIETHDCFAMTEYAAIDSFGITAPGESWQAVEDGTIAFDGKLPINPSGGLIGLGHPVGATGVRMMLDSYKQVTGEAGDYQVEGCNRAGMLNIGGSTTTIASFVVGNAGL
jgi:acetyl-CoA C-acetyltransferase